MTQNNIVTNFLEEMNGQLVVGNWIIKMNSPHGAIVNIATEEEKSTLRSRSTPLILQQPLDNLLDRQESIKEAIAAFHAGQSVEFCGASGFGKTVLLRHLEHNHQVKSLFADGIISLSSLHPNVEDLLQFIWDAFYESNIPYKPTPHQIFQQIQEKQALVVLDDGLIQDELQELMNIASHCTFLIASSKSRIKKKERSMMLSGLPIHDGLALMERELQRPLNREEQFAAKSLYSILNGNPMHLQMAMASIREEGRSLDEMVSLLPTSTPGNFLLKQIIASQSTSERIILELLTIMGGIGLENEQVTAITQNSDAFDTLERLRRHHLVQLDGSRYKVSKTIVEILPPQWKLTALLEKAIAYFVDWTEHHQQQSSILLVQIDPIVQILEVAVRDNRWKDVLRLVKAVEGTLALSKQWGLWEQVLQRGLQASQVERDKAAQAWALHQLGTRALCLEENSTAKNYLTKARQLRESVDDGRGVAATRHNLNVLGSFPSSQTHNHQQENLEDSAQEDGDSHSSSVQRLLTRMNIISSQNASLSRKRVYNNVLLSPKRIITTGILASAGLLAWFNWHGFIPAPSAKSTSTPTTTVKPSSIPEQKPTLTPTPSPIIEPPSPVMLPLSPLPTVTPKINPPITPNFEEEQPTVPKREKSKRKFIPAPAPAPTPALTPATSDVPTFIQPTPDTTIVPTPTAEATPTPTLTPSQTPNVELNQPSVEPTSTPTFTPIPTPVPSSQVEAIPTPTAITITPIAEPPKSTIEKNTENRTQNTQ
ncbi:MAG: NB-ARC domain-containing protein [Brasilonema sp.]